MIRKNTIPLSETHPELAKKWHPTKNILKPTEVCRSSKIKVWFLCPKGHEWESSVHAQSKYPDSCPYCSGQKVCKENSLQTLYPEIATQWNEESNGDLTPEMVTGCSARKVWWKCSEGHVWKSRIFSRTKNGSQCPFCKGKKPTEENNIAVLYPELIKEWHPELNKGLDPKDCSKGSGKKIWWKCEKGHIWKSMIWHRIDGGRAGRGTNCPYCSNQLIDDKNNLAIMNPELAAEWHSTKNGSLTPDKVGAGARQKIWWQCPKGEDHVWLSLISQRKYSGCPCCSGRKVVPSNCLATTHPHIAAEWHSKNKLKPTEVTYATNQRAWFICPKNPNHEWKATIYHRAVNSTGCPFCASSKGEKAIKKLLEDNHIEFKQQYKFKDCKNKRPLPFDFALFNKEKVIGVIEFQGKQHYVPVPIFGGLEQFRYRGKLDLIKENYCKNNNILLLIIPFWEIEAIDARLNDFIKILN